jgi:transcriptional regulator with XRE-family HTH domain
MGPEFVKELRNQKGWSQSELAALCGLSVKTIHRIEHGQGAPSLDTAKALASVFDRPFSDFLFSQPLTEASAQPHRDRAEPKGTTSSQGSADVYANLLRGAERFWRSAVITVIVATLFGLLTKLYLDMETLSQVVTDLASVRTSDSASGPSGGPNATLICSTDNRCEIGSFDHYYGDQALIHAFHDIDGNTDDTGGATLLELVMLRDTARIVTAWEESAKRNSDVSSRLALSNYLQCYSDSRSMVFSASDNIAKMQDCVYAVLIKAQWEVGPGMNQALMNLARRMQDAGPYQKQFRLPVSAEIADY